MRFSKPFSTLAGGLLVALLCRDAHAWGSKEHIILTNLAAQRVIADPNAPKGLKDWLKKVCPDLGTPQSQREFFINGHVGVTKKDAKGMTWWCIEPDSRSGDKKTLIPPFPTPEQPLHFVDLEYLNADESKHDYKHDLSRLPAMADIPRDLKDPRWVKAGVLPFSVEWAYKNLVDSIKAKRLAFDPSKPDAPDSALVWAGKLAHYLEDNTQPMHGTADYMGRSYFGDKRGAPNVHSEMEYKMNDDDKYRPTKLRAEYWDLLMKELRTAKDPADQKDLWKGTLEVSIAGYKHLPLIGLAAMDASGQQGTPDKPVGRAGPLQTERFFRYSSDVTGKHETVMQMKARQQAWAIVRVAAIWTKAWEEAEGK